MDKNIENDEVSLKELLQKVKEWISYLLSEWKVVLLACFIGGLLGLTYSLIKKTRLYCNTIFCNGR
jgi:hypothetical protein